MPKQKVAPATKVAPTTKTAPAKPVTTKSPEFQRKLDAAREKAVADMKAQKAKEPAKVEAKTPQAQPAKPAGKLNKMIGKDVVYVDSGGSEYHARIVAGDSETVNLVITRDSKDNPIQHISNVKKGTGSKPHTWHEK